MIAKTLHWIPLLAFWVGLGIVSYRFIFTNKRSAKVLHNGRIEFSQSRIWILGCILMGLRLMLVAVDVLRHGIAEPFDFSIRASYELILPFGFLLLLARSLPGTVVVTDGGLEQIFWLRKNKYIRWQEIVEINAGEKSRIVTVTGADKSTIIHSRELADRPRFLLELKQHCGENLPADFPRETTLN